MLVDEIENIDVLEGEWGKGVLTPHKPLNPPPKRKSLDVLYWKTSYFRSKTTGCLETSNPGEDSQEHPLRILSEENLTVVSTFVADLAELEADQAELEALETASRLSFFKVDIFQSIYLSMYQSIYHYLSIYMQGIFLRVKTMDDKLMYNSKFLNEIHS